MDLRECPYCHRPFEGQQLAKEQVDWREATKVSDFPIEPGIGIHGDTQGGLYQPRRAPTYGLSEEEKKTVALNPEAFITYEVAYRCKHCGKEWTKLSVEKVSLPREYVAEERED